MSPLTALEAHSKRPADPDDAGSRYRKSRSRKSAGMTVEERTNERAAFGSIFFQSLTIRFSELLSLAGSEMREAH